MNTPPKILTWLLELLSPGSRPDLRGDVLELYDRRREEYGPTHANKKLLADILTVIPMRFIVKEKNKPSVFMLTTNLKIARRNLVKNKLYSSINLIGLSVSLTACILITLFVRDELSFDKHFQDGARIFRIGGRYDQGGDSRVEGAYTSYLLQPMLEGNIPGIDYMGRINFDEEMITIDGSKQYLESDIMHADSTFFDIFSLAFIAGNPLTALDEPTSVVLDQPTAQKYFGNEESLGKTIEMKGKTFTVTGVIKEFPRSTHFNARIIFPMTGISPWFPGWVFKDITGTSMYTYVKAGPNFNKDECEAAINKLVASRWKNGYPAPTFFLQPVTSIHLQSNLRGEILTNGSQTTVYIFSGIALIILVLACINYINLSMAGSLQRVKEIGIKQILGSTSRMQVFQFQTESLIILALSAVLAVVLARLAMPFFNNVTGKVLSFHPLTDSDIAVGLIALVVLVGLIAGSFPALALLRFNPIGMLSGKLPLKSNSYFRNILITFQFAISIALIISTLIVMDQIDFIRRKDLGVDPEQLVIIPFQVPEISARYELMREELLRNRNVLHVGASSDKVTWGVSGWRPYVDRTKPDATVNIPSIAVSHDFFETMGAKMAAGRTYSRSYPSDAAKAYIINEAAAKFLKLDNPVGEPLNGFTFTGSKWFKKEAQIIGVVKDFHFASLHSPVGPIVFSLASEMTEGVAWMEVRIANENRRETIQFIERLWTRLAPERPFQFEFMDEEVQKNYQAEDQFLKVFVTFSVLSIMLGCLGLFGLTAFMTRRRTKEIGIRKVIGASTTRLIRILSVDFLKLVVISNLIGWPIAYYMMNQWLQNFAYQTSLSLWIFVLTGAAAFTIAFIAILYHTLKVSMANPVKALRYE